MIKIGIAAVLALGLLFTPIQVHAGSCPCEFDTDRYSAKAEGEGYCSATTKEGKHCVVVFNGEIRKRVQVEASSVYGPFDKYVSHLDAINKDLMKTPAIKLMSESKWVTNNLPLMIRSSYAAASFVKHEERETLDIKLKTIFTKYDKSIYEVMIKGAAPVLEKDFAVQKGRFEFQVQNIKVKFATFILP